MLCQVSSIPPSFPSRNFLRCVKIVAIPNPFLLYVAFPNDPNDNVRHLATDNGELSQLAPVFFSQHGHGGGGGGGDGDGGGGGVPNRVRGRGHVSRQLLLSLRHEDTSLRFPFPKHFTSSSSGSRISLSRHEGRNK
ncbi:hypothetical protein E2C01_054577 [Portunus trituberculatus]|uniref:Uncharacterized protein n=1 Tax=Portunus trituberculatus TaxID=210409 RepID=A0A5B7GJZ7_PORTR|nr:hypothetical protein [Portunus trituberculatus]